MYKYKPSKKDREEYKNTMILIDKFLINHPDISSSRSGDSFYFSAPDGKKVRVSNHTIEASNGRAVNDSGEQLRDKYHEDGRDNDTIYIHAGKTRIIEIYTAIMAGKKINGKGNVI
jgi:hypothetical protein